MQYQGVLYYFDATVPANDEVVIKMAKSGPVSIVISPSSGVAAAYFTLANPDSPHAIWQELIPQSGLTANAYHLAPVWAIKVLAGAGPCIVQVAQ